MMKAAPHLLVTALTAIILSLSAARAGDVSIPNEFQANTPAKAAEVNENFASVATAINDNDTRIGTLETSTASLGTTVGELENGLSAKVARAGDTMTGNLTVPKIVYSSPRSHVACIAGDVFRPRLSTDGYTSGFGNGGARITTPSSTGALQAQVHLPDGATITYITFHFYDNDPINDLRAYVLCQSFNGSYRPVGLTGDTYSSSGAGPATQAVSMAPSSNNVVQNTNGAITVFVSPTTGSAWSSALAIRGVAFTYTLPEAQ